MDPRRVLVVEDDPAAAELVALALADEFNVEAAPNAALALERFEAFRPDIVILDMRLEDGTDGVDVFQEMRRRLGRPPAAIILSSADEADAAARALSIPVLRKPLNRRSLTDMVRRVLADQGSRSQWRDAVEPGTRVAAEIDGMRRVGTVIEVDRGIVRFRDNEGNVFIVARERAERA